MAQKNRLGTYLNYWRQQEPEDADGTLTPRKIIMVCAIEFRKALGLLHWSRTVADALLDWCRRGVVRWVEVPGLYR